MKRASLFDDPRIAALYADVPIEPLQKYKAFLRDFPYRFVKLDDMEWAYLASEHAGDDLLALSGALCAPEVSGNTIAALAGKYRVITPEYPPVKDMDALADGIAGILRQLGVKRAHVLGGSYGGFVAQVFVRRHPEMSRSLVLSHTLPPFPDSAGASGT